MFKAKRPERRHAMAFIQIALKIMFEFLGYVYVGY